MTTGRKVVRSITLSLHIIAMIIYYLPTLITGGQVAVVWLVIGVLQTIIFCVVFFRDSRTRMGLSITLMVIATLWNFIMLLMIAFFALILPSFGLGIINGLLYTLCTLIAVIFALCFPRKYKSIDGRIGDTVESVRPLTVEA